MKKLVFAICAMTIATAGFAQSNDNPGSLWPQKFQNPLLDRTARNVGDILTVVISESSASSFAATTSTSKKDSTSVERSQIPLLNRLNIGILNDLLGAQSTGATSSTSGSGQTTQSGKFTTRMSVMVKEVLPNGNLVIEGVRWINVNKETQSFKLTGIIRRDDVRADNTVLSESIADAQITASGKGTIAERQRKGLLTQVLDWLF